MSASQRRFFSGDTLRQALVQAANQFQLPPEEIAYRTLDKRHGFIKNRPKVLIEVDAAAPRLQAKPSPLAPAAPATPATPATPVPPKVAAAVTPLAPAVPQVAPAAAAVLPAAAAAVPAPAATHPELGFPVIAAATPPAAAPVAPMAAMAPAAPAASAVPASLPPAARPVSAPEALSVPAAPVRERPAQRPRSEERRPPRPERPERPERREPVARPEARGEEEGLIVLPERPRSASERFPVATGPIAVAAEKGLELLLGIAGLDLAPKILEGDERLEIELFGPDAARCFEEEGEILRSIEHLLPRVLRALGVEAIPCRVDSDNFHEIREEQLRTLAQRVAAEVRRRGQSRTLEPMNPADRRIVHMTLEDDPGVDTASDGEGYFKRVTIRPA